MRTALPTGYRRAVRAFEREPGREGVSPSRTRVVLGASDPAKWLSSSHTEGGIRMESLDLVVRNGTVVSASDTHGL